MIREVEIQNFKSIRKLRLECRRINLFIGSPDTGKSNLLESLGMFGLPYDPEKLRAFARCRTMADLFHDQDMGSPVRVRADGYDWTLEYEPRATPPFQIKAGRFELSQFVFFACRYDLDATIETCGAFNYHLIPFRFYRFAWPERFPEKWPDFLRPPHGENMLHLLLRCEPLRERIAGIFEEHGLRLVLRPWEARIELQKEAEGRAIAYPYAMASEALCRLVFHLLAIETNEGGFLIFEEPEAHLHPPPRQVSGGAGRPRRAKSILDLHPQRPFPAGRLGEGTSEGRGGVPDRAARRRDPGPSVGGGGGPRDRGRGVRLLFRLGAPHVHVRELVALKVKEGRTR